MSVLRGRVVWPLGPSRAVLLEDGVVAADLPRPRPARTGDPPAVAGVIVPAFSDWHFHWVQTRIAGRASSALLPWLGDVAWPEEQRLADAATCAAEVGQVAHALRAAGTLAGAAYAGPDAHTAAAFLAATTTPVLCGPAVMTTGGPVSLVRPIGDSLDTLERLADRFGDRVVVAPRFALSATSHDLRRLGDLAVRRGLPIQTHLSENPDELDAVRRMHPHAQDYTAVYELAGLLGPQTLLGHAIHVSDDELRRIAAAQAVVVHCPTSNRALGSGRMPLERLRSAGVRWTLGSDVGAGPRLEMLDVLAEAVVAHEGHADLLPVDAWHRATLGRAALFSGGSEADLVRCGERPGLLVVAEPEGGAAARTPEAWLRSWIAGWRREARTGIERIVGWDEVVGVGACR